MYELEDEDEKAAFYEQGSDRAVAVVCTAIVIRTYTTWFLLAVLHPTVPDGSPPRDDSSCPSPR